MKNIEINIYCQSTEYDISVCVIVATLYRRSFHHEKVFAGVIMFYLLIIYYEQ